MCHNVIVSWAYKRFWLPVMLDSLSGSLLILKIGVTLAIFYSLGGLLLFKDWTNNKSGF